MFGILGLTFLFVFAQALYLSRYMTEPDKTDRTAP
jgi:intracellular septation protein A